MSQSDRNQETQLINDSTRGDCEGTLSMGIDSEDELSYRGEMTPAQI